MKILILFLSIVVIQCNQAQVVKNPTGLPKAIKFCVISDVHYYDTTLGTTSKSFLANISADRKMIAQSEAIFESALNSIIQEKPDFLLISGDLTKDGEKIGHQEVADHLKMLKNSGIQTYVIPGNHDILNYGAYSFLTDYAVSIDNVTPQEFASIYADYGYNQALYRDTASLSYVVEPANGLWLIAMDGCRYKENTPGKTSLAGGNFSYATLKWIEQQLQLAKVKNKVVIGMVHHGVLEHFTGEKTFFSDYVLDDYKQVDSIFTKYDMKLVFTGHYHAQDITENLMGDGKILYDVETGSLVNYPSPYRVITIGTDLSVNINSYFVKSINSNLNGQTFPDYAYNFLISGMTDLIQKMLTDSVSLGGFGLPPNYATLVSPLGALAFAAHYAGDENPSADTKTLISFLLSNSDPNVKLAGTLLNSLWTDLPPQDNNVQFDIKTETTGVDFKSSNPASFVLFQNYPNPFNPSTSIKYNLPFNSSVKIEVFNLLGERVDVLVNGNKNAGTYEINFNSEGFASGIYFYKITARSYDGKNEFRDSKKMIVLK